MECEYGVTTTKHIESAVQAVIMQTESAGFKVLHIHNVQQTLANKGFEIEPMQIIEVCNAANAYNLLQMDKKLSLFLPCKIVVYSQNGKTIISALRPHVIKYFSSDEKISKLVQNVESTIRLIVDSAAKTDL